MSSHREVNQPTVSSRARMGWTVPLGSPAAVPISTPYSSFDGSASRARRTSWVGKVGDDGHGFAGQAGWRCSWTTSGFTLLEEIGAYHGVPTVGPSICARGAPGSQNST